MAIKKHEEIRLNVKPIFLTLYHEYVFEGPCRFGEGIQLEKEFDLHMAAEKFKGWYAQLQAAMPENVVNLLEPVKVERDENFLTKDEMIDKLAEGSEEVDLYFIGPPLRFGSRVCSARRQALRHHPGMLRLCYHVRRVPCPRP